MKKEIVWNTDWRFLKTDGASFDVKSELATYQTISLPHTWYEDEDYYRGSAVYQKVFNIEIEEGNKTFIQFDGVDKVCQVILNGAFVGSHEGGYSAFAMEITQYLKHDGKNILTVLVDNSIGKSVNPLSGDFTIFGGIYRDVKLLVTESINFDYTYYGTSGVLLNTELLPESLGIVYAKSHVVGNYNDETCIKYLVYDEIGNEVANYSTKVNQECKILVKNPIQWNGLKNPYLYKVKVILLHKDIIYDEVEKIIGFRSFSLDADQGFFLNDNYMKIKGVAKHQDVGGVFSATTKEEWVKDISLIMEMGANAVRLSHYQHPQGTYDLCDQEGLVVWAEIPLLKLTESEELFENAKQQMTELVLQNMHHPSIVFWGIQNEIAMFGEQPFMTDKVKKLEDLAKELDPFRLTTAANLNTVEIDSTLNEKTDAIAYNVYYGWYYGEMIDFEKFVDSFHRDRPNIPLGISEYGVDANILFHTDKPKVKDYSEEFQALYHEKIYSYIQDRSFIWGSFVWNMFDFVSGIRKEGGTKFRNNKGLVSHDRKTPKDSYYYYKAIWSTEPFVHIAQKRYLNRVSETMCLKVYSNQSAVTLYADDKKYTKYSNNGIFLFDDVTLQMGENSFLAVSGLLNDQATFNKVNVPDESYKFVDPHPATNVKNWFADEVEKAEVFPDNAFSVVDKVGDLLKSSEAMNVIRKILPNVGEYLPDTIPTFSLDMVINYSKLANEDQMKELNQALIKISKK